MLRKTILEPFYISKEVKTLKKIKIFGVLLSLCLIVALVFTSCGPKEAPPAAPPASPPTAPPAPPPATPPSTETFKWTFSHMAWDSPFGWGFNAYPRYQDMVKEATGGRLIMESKIDLFPVAETVFGVIDGRADMGFQPVAFSSGTFPFWDIASIPFLFGHIFEYEQMVNDPDWVEIMRKTHEEVGLVKLFECTSERSDAVFANKALRTVDDFEGVKIRTAGMLITEALQAIGGSPMTISSGEIQQALLQGTVDGAHTSIGFGLAGGMADVTDYLSLWGFQPSFPGEVIVNKKSFDALPADLQQILMDVSREFQGQMFFAVDSYYRTAKFSAAATKIELVIPEEAEVEKMRTMTKSVVDKWLEVAGPYGPELLAIVEKYAYGGK